MAKNPFKFGSVVDGPFFTDRTREIEKVQMLFPLGKIPEREFKAYLSGGGSPEEGAGEGGRPLNPNL